MRFIDGSAFLYAFLKPKRPLPRKVAEMKANAQSILRRVNEGEEVLTSVVHVSEIANILEARIALTECGRIVGDIVSKSSVRVVDVTKNLYVASMHTADVHDVSVNDALALNIMKDRDINEIYSFDKHFDNMPEIRRLTR
ncbi:MAG: type II toxin-antitoxin system VapC family toxin [Candidatus Brockarchaeota archaeon]|nr:type II toxin-antitoxin system VapC family toxin [Candidatus Brockarchaeota archaeon]